MRKEESNIAEEIFNKTLEEKFGKAVNLSLSVPTALLEEFTNHAVSCGHLNINSALIEMMKAASKPKKSKKLVPPE